MNDCYEFLFTIFLALILNHIPSRVDAYLSPFSHMIRLDWSIAYDLHD